MGRQKTFKIGDLVKCIYDLFDYYEYDWDQSPQKGYPFYGIILSVEDGFLHEEEFGYDRLYVVQCFDGHLRFFAEWEMKLVSTSP